MKNKKRIGLRTFFECFLGSAAIIGVLSAVSLVESGTAPLMQRIEKMEKKLKEKDREIEDLRTEKTEMELSLENKQSQIDQLTEEKKPVEEESYQKAPHPDLYRGEYGFQYCPNWSWDPWYSWNCKKYYHDLKNK